MPKLRTGISKAYWCEPDRGKWTFKPAFMPAITQAENIDMQVTWLDVLLDGGIEVPKWALDSNNDHRALTMLVSGPPGVGKSTFVFELVYRLAHFGLDGTPWHTIYVSTETSALGLQHQVIEHGWFRRDPEGGLRDENSWLKEIKNKVHRRKEVHNSKDRIGPHIDVIEETEDFAGYLDSSKGKTSRSVRILDSLIIALTGGKTIQGPANEIKDIINERNATNIVEDIKPDILVIDSLNTVGQDERGELFNKFLHIRQLAPKLVIIILDAEGDLGKSGFWAYACDMVFHLDKIYPEGYMIRTLEVVKARYQSHIWGIHQLKIYGKHFIEPASDGKEITKLRRAHPYREEGGVFIYPSIHFVLSKYKRLSHSEKPNPIPLVPNEITNMLNKGLPKWRCTGFVGVRGGHKSHLGYLNLLNRVKAGAEERALVISLRDDEGMARKTMQGILEKELGGGLSLEELEAKDRVEILHYPPGYITPEEFFHRMMLSVHRLKHASQDSQVTVLFNSLDQLGSRFPLCANQRIFIPGVIEALCAEQVTSIFIGVQEPGQPPEQYGLLSMADLILSFNRCRFSCKDYAIHVLDSKHSCDEASLAACQGQFESKRGKEIDCVVVRVQRFAGGQAAGAGGILELVDETDPLIEYYGKAGLFFAELSPRAGQGMLIDSDGVAY